MKPADIELIKKVQQNDEIAFEELYHRYYPNAYRIAYQITKSDADAQDAVQETFIQIKKSIINLREPEFFYTWMSRIVLSKCNRMFVKNHYAPMDPDRMVVINNNPEQRKYMIPHQQTFYLSEQEVLLAMIEQLKPKLKEVLYMMYFEQMKLQDIAYSLDIPLSTAKTRAARARLDLKKKLHEFEKLEGRSLEFNVDTLFPMASFGIGTMILQNCKTKLSQFFTGNAVNVVGAVSMVSLTVSAGVFVVQDYEQAQAEIKQSNRQPQMVEAEEIPKHEDLILSSFNAVPYDETNITSPMEAYFTCINWAETTDDIKTKNQEDIKEILPVYEALKQDGGAYWQRLTNSLWSESFEAQRNQLH